MIDLTGHRTIITGAGAGIGRGTALSMAAAHASVALLDIDRANLDNTVSQIRSAGGDAVAFTADVSDTAQVRAVFAAISRHWPDGADSVVNIVGVEFFKEFDDVTETDWDRQIAINLKSVFTCGQLGARLLRQRGGGCIINTASVQAFATTGRTAPYAAAKGGVVSLTRDMARDLGQFGIRVNTVCPGCIRSPMLDRSFTSEADRQKCFSMLESILPMRRIGRPEDFANLVKFLISPMATYITGQTINVDGGMMCRLPLA